MGSLRFLLSLVLTDLVEPVDVWPDGVRGAAQVEGARLEGADWNSVIPYKSPKESVLYVLKKNLFSFLSSYYMLCQRLLLLKTSLYWKHASRVLRFLPFMSNISLGLRYFDGLKIILVIFLCFWINVRSSNYWGKDCRGRRKKFGRFDFETPLSIVPKKISNLSLLAGNRSHISWSCREKTMPSLDIFS